MSNYEGLGIREASEILAGYYEIANISTKRASMHDTGTWYLYAPISNLRIF